MTLSAMNGEQPSDVFAGPDRIEHCDALGRPIRKGHPDEHRVSDLARVRAALQGHDFAAALAIAASLRPMYAAITTTFLEWCLALPATLAQAGHAGYEPAVTRAGAMRWRANIAAASAHTAGARALMAELLAPEQLSPDTISEYRAQQAAGGAIRAATLLGEPDALYAQFAAAAEQQDAAPALSAFTRYVDEMRSRHDLAGEFVSTYAGVIQEQIDEPTAAAVLQDALESCAVLKGMWDAFVRLTPEVLAAVLAEHLRGHFSGPGREGSVRIIEEPDRYRLLFEPCGTGGAMRQRQVAGLTKYREPSAATWHRAGEVPSYCAHCALNEITSIKRLGYPAWVTEFDPDPQKPCGWTVYKKRELIPERYFTRLGMKKTC
jgi:hypothetical protein